VDGSGRGLTCGTYLRFGSSNRIRLLNNLWHMSLPRCETATCLVRSISASRLIETFSWPVFRTCILSANLTIPADPP
jgi:hypothetical protein